MLKFPRSLDEIDPLPDNLTHEWWFDGEIGLDTRASVRHTDEWRAQAAKEAGEDWKKIPGRLYWFRNGKDQLRYAPPLPEEPPKGKRLEPKQPIPYAWVGRRIPKVGDRIKRDSWLKYYPVVAETATHVTLFDGNFCRWEYSKDLPWEFE